MSNPFGTIRYENRRVIFMLGKMPQYGNWLALRERNAS